MFLKQYMKNSKKNLMYIKIRKWKRVNIIEIIYSIVGIITIIIADILLVIMFKELFKVLKDSDKEWMKKNMKAK